MFKYIFFRGLATSLSLIAAIGVQNTFLLRQGIQKQHVFLICCTCLVCDVFLMALGIFGVDLIITSPVLERAISVAGCLFLFAYSLMAFRSVYRSAKMLEFSPTRMISPRTAFLTTLMVTLLNPHAYLDAVVILGGLCVPLTLPEKQVFMLGALAASMIWFFGIGYGARLLEPLFKSNRAWQVLDALTGIMMLTLGLMLLKSLF